GTSATLAHKMVDRPKVNGSLYGNYTNVWSFLPPNNKNRPGVKNLAHVSMKPIEVCKRLIEMTTQPGDIVLDPFLGTGPVVDAARTLGRHAIGIETKEEYCEIAVKRLQQSVLPLGGVA